MNGKNTHSILDEIRVSLFPRSDVPIAPTMWPLPRSRSFLISTTARNKPTRLKPDSH